MPVFLLNVRSAGSEQSVEHCVGDLVCILNKSKGKGAGCRGTVQKIRRSYTFILPEDGRGEVRAQHRFIEVVKQPESHAAEAQEALMEAREIGREKDVLNKILRNQEDIMEKLRALNLKQEKLQRNVQEIHEHVFHKIHERF